MTRGSSSPTSNWPPYSPIPEDSQECPFCEPLEGTGRLRVLHDRRISLDALSLTTNGKSVGRVFYREFSNRRFAGTTLTESGKEYIANVVEVPNLATILLADLIPAVVVREQQATGMPLRHRMHQLEMQFEWLSADGVERNPRAKFRHRSVDGQPVAVRMRDNKAAWVGFFFDEDLRRCQPRGTASGVAGHSQTGSS